MFQDGTVDICDIVAALIFYLQLSKSSLCWYQILLCLHPPIAPNVCRDNRICLTK